MKEVLIVALSASLALPGCITQRRTVLEIEKAKQQVDAIVATLDTTHPMADMNSTILPMFAVDSEVANYMPFQAPDTTLVIVDMAALPVEGKVIDTGKQTLLIKPIIGEKGEVSISVRTVMKPIPEPVPTSASASAEKHVLPDMYHIILFLIAGIGMAAQMLIKWLERKTKA